MSFSPKILFASCWLALFFNTVSAQEVTVDTSSTKKVHEQAPQRAPRAEPAASKSPTGAVIRSMIIPGWGQCYNGKKFKAALAFCAECTAAGSAIYWNQQVVSGPYYYRDDYINWRNEGVWWLVGIVLISMADAYVDAHLSDFDESPDISIQLHPQPGWERIKATCLVQLSLQF